MARSFNGSTDRIDYAPSVDISSNPFSISLFIDYNSLSGTQYTLNSESATEATAVTLQKNNNIGTHSLFIDTNGTTLNRVSLGAATIAAGFQHLCATWDGVLTDRTGINMYLDGVSGSSGGTNGTGTADVTSTRWSIGGRQVDDLRNVDGNIADVAVWDAELTASEVLSLSLGLSALFVRPQSLVFYAPLVNSQHDVVGGIDGALDGTGTFAHPPIIYPSAQILQFPPVAAAAPAGPNLLTLLGVG